MDKDGSVDRDCYIDLFLFSVFNVFCRKVPNKLRSVCLTKQRGAGSIGRVAPTDCSVRAPTDPYMVLLIRLLKSWIQPEHLPS